MRNDPAETGGLFIGRRPGTAPVRYRAAPVLAGPLRQRLDGWLAGTILGALIALSLLCLGPIPLGCLWLGSQLNYLTGYVSWGIAASFGSMLTGLLVTLMAMRQLDHAWILARRAAGHDQRTGVLARVFAACVILAVLAFNFWFFVMKGPGSGWTPPIGKGW